MTKQIPSIILPTVWTVGTETETINDLVEHTSIEFCTEFLDNITVHITATEVSAFAASVPGVLNCWVEQSPYPSANTDGTVQSYWPPPLPTATAYWAAIGGGGGVNPPIAPQPEVSLLAGAAGTLVHGILLNWNNHAPWTRVILQTPVAAALPLAWWVVQVMVSAKTT